MSKDALDQRPFLRYARAVEAYFCKKRGAPLTVSPNDFLKIEEWFEKGIPQRAVEKGLDRHFEKLDPSRHRHAIVLRFAEGKILDEWEFMKSGGASESGRRQTPEEEAAERKKRLDVFIHRCRKAHSGAELWAGALFNRLIAKAHGGLSLPTAEMAEALNEIADDYLRKTTTPERMRTARCTAMAALAPYRDRLSAERYIRSLETNTLEALRIEIGVPKLMEM